MTQEEKELLLKDLCARLSYGVNVEYTFKVTVIATNAEEIMTRTLYLYSINTLDNMTVSGIDDDGYETICFFEEIKPYLFPLSSMTEEERIAIGNEFAYGQPQKAIDILHKRHIDYRGLIPMGLAIDATGKNIY